MSFTGFTPAQVNKIKNLQKNRITKSHKANSTLNNVNERAATASRVKLFDYITEISKNYPGQNRNVRRAAQNLVYKITQNTPMNIPVHNFRQFNSGNAAPPTRTYTNNRINTLVNNAMRLGFNIGNRTYHALALKLHPNKVSANKRAHAEALFKRLGALKNAGAFGL